MEVMCTNLANELGPHGRNGQTGQAMSELWEEDETLRRALPWKALSLQAPQKEMRCRQRGVFLTEPQRVHRICE